MMGTLVLGALRPYVNLALVTLQYLPLGLGLTPDPGVGVSVKRGGNMVAPPTPGVGVGPAAGGRPLPVTTPTNPGWHSCVGALAALWDLTADWILWVNHHHTAGTNIRILRTPGVRKQEMSPSLIMQVDILKYIYFVSNTETLPQTDPSVNYNIYKTGQSCQFAFSKLSALVHRYVILNCMHAHAHTHAHTQTGLDDG